MNNKFKIKANKQKGFTLLLSLLVVSIILSVGFGVFDTMTKELKISGIGRESQIAFYAADAGVECAYFWDIKNKIFENIIEGIVVDGSIKCASSKMSIDVPESSFSGGVTTYEFKEFSFGMGEKCAKVKVTKDVFNSDDDLNKITKTTIQSRGYNYPCASDSKHKVERAIRVISTKTEEVEP